MANTKRVAQRADRSGRPRIGIDAVTARGEIFDFVQRRGRQGATCDEIEYRLSYPHQTASARVHELAKAGVIEPAGLSRSTRYGRPAVVYRVSFWTDVYVVDESALEKTKPAAL